VQGRVDKACLDVVDEAVEGPSKVLQIGLRATLLKPYAVFLRK
jgi:hypothetical protein